MSGEPKPGSVAAKALGCKCPSDDNNGGLIAPFPPDGWWVRPDCPVHRITPDCDLDRSAVPDEEPPRP